MRLSCLCWVSYADFEEANKIAEYHINYECKPMNSSGMYFMLTGHTQLVLKM